MIPFFNLQYKGIYMNLTNISYMLGCSKQNVSQVASSGIKNLFKGLRNAYNLTYLEAYEMALVGLDIYGDDSDVKYFFKHLTKSDKENLDKERANFIRNK